MPTLHFNEGTAGLPAPQPHVKQLMNNIVDGLASTRPMSVYAKIPRDDTTFKAGFRKITYRDLANAVNGFALWLVEKFGVSTSFETLAYIGPWDIRYIVSILGAVKAGYKMVFPSATYPAAGLCLLLQRLQCDKLLLGSQSIPVAIELASHMELLTSEIPPLSSLLGTEYPHYPYKKTFQEARSEPLLVLHTAGTTGTPKPLVISHDWAAAWIQQNQALAPEGYVSREQMTHGIELVGVAPPNHTSNFMPNFFGAIPNGMTVLFPLPNSPFNTETVMELIRHNDPSMLIAAPFIIDGIAHNADLLREVSAKVSMIGFGGGPLSPQAAAILTRHFRVVGMYGTTETGVFAKMHLSGAWDAGSWNSFMFHPDEGMDFRPVVGQGDSHEAVVVRNLDPEKEQTIFKLYPDLKEYSTRDLFKPDAERPGFWLYQGRLDDILILSTGETVNPVGYEHMVSSHELISLATMIGTNLPRPALLVEMVHPDEAADPAEEDHVWRLVEEANSAFPPQASIIRSHMIILRGQDRLPRSPKGSVQRKKVLEMFCKSIEKVYGVQK